MFFSYAFLFTYSLIFHEVTGASLDNLPTELVIQIYRNMGINSRIAFADAYKHYSLLLEEKEAMADKLFFALGVDELKNMMDEMEFNPVNMKMLARHANDSNYKWYEDQYLFMNTITNLKGKLLLNATVESVKRNLSFWLESVSDFNQIQLIGLSRADLPLKEILDSGFNAIKLIESSWMNYMRGMGFNINIMYPKERPKEWSLEFIRCGRNSMKLGIQSKSIRENIRLLKAEVPRNTTRISELSTQWREIAKAMEPLSDFFKATIVHDTNGTRPNPGSYFFQGKTLEKLLLSDAFS